MHALLIGNGETQETVFLQNLAQQADLILAADGGADRALSAGVRPDVVIGDLDSVSPQAKKILPAEKFIFVNNQNNTDLEKALDYLAAHQCTQCTLTGFVGGRWDFTFGNFLSVYPYLDKMDICVAGKGWKIWPLTHSVTKNVRPGARVSLIPAADCQNVTLQGLVYPLEHANLSLGRTGQTLSNVAKLSEIKILFDKGFLLLYIED
ncbi:thiamine diphosphokinase [Candidatus Avelusimicrobium sp.]|uniref:thiamine diphosphokinase n=1 Tax=Candidatus Avelusimicrobium sp. TaxID=3048833 RepID=UPI003F7F4AD1